MSVSEIVIYVLLALIILQIVLSATLFPFLSKKKMKKEAEIQRKMLREIKNGHEVLLVSGIFGKVVNKKDNDLWIEISPNVVVKVSRSAVAGFFDADLKKKQIAEQAEKKKVKRWKR
ncbi:preprotein translocase subunit YajC [[Mycoplasma] testudinis]|uniref:preprotein translocase subunit YajC n=1 Tax=[Mycoplasma] testudinis TaxID=33924 RepID=UPI00069828C6|nr:preprotein translocase subunit YajC [[Mycoplasma] testudinis]